MNSLNIFTKRILGLDNRVWVVLLVTCLLCVGLLGYRFMDHEPCTTGTITINGKAAQGSNTYNIGDLLTFNLSTPYGNRVTWDPGDESDKKEGSIISHKFIKEGRFQVTATINGKCEETVDVRIKANPLPQDGYKNFTITGNSYTIEGANEKYYCTVSADSYMWMIVNKENPQAQKDAAALFTFPAAGTYTIELTLNNDPSKKVLKEITVLPKVVPEKPGPMVSKVPKTLPVLLPDNPAKQVDPNAGKLPVEIKTPEKPPQENPPAQQQPKPAEPAEKPKKKEVLPETFKAELEDVMKFKKNPEELADKYLFYGGTTMVQVNDEKVRHFTQLCYDLRGSKKYKIESVSFQKDENGNIQVILLKLDKIGIINRVLKKGKD